MTDNHLRDLEQALGITPTTTTGGLNPYQGGEWFCPECHNRNNFIGVDKFGYGGPSACKGFEDGFICPSGLLDDGYCSCHTVLTQVIHVTPLPDGDVDLDYEAWTGGGYDGEIGPFTLIFCQNCGHILWELEK